MCGIFKEVGKLFGGGGDTPVVVRESPIADQAGIDTAAADKAAQEKATRRRKLRASSLLATGGVGDTSSPVTGLPNAKPTLGA